MSNEGSLDLVLAALKELGGYFVWADSSGEEYVVISRRDFEARTSLTKEAQLDLLSAASHREGKLDHWTADDMLEKINRDLALYQLQQEDQPVEEEEEGQFPLPPKAGKSVRFEPLRGDLPPDLQE